MPAPSPSPCGTAKKGGWRGGRGGKGKEYRGGGVTLVEHACTIAPPCGIAKRGGRRGGGSRTGRNAMGMGMNGACNGATRRLAPDARWKKKSSCSDARDRNQPV
eukprot:scaffold6834_cov128-Isochrysis_galbana.AAC.2